MSGFDRPHPRPRSRPRINSINMNPIPEGKVGQRAVFDHEKLDVYQLELQFIAWVTPLLDEVKTSGKPRIAEVSDHLDRASLSALLNTAEGNGKRPRQGRAKFFDDARGSATECAGCLDALVAKGACDIGRVQEGKDLLLRVVSMLSKLVNMYSEDLHLKEGAVDYGRDEQVPA